MTIKKKTPKKRVRKSRVAKKKTAKKTVRKTRRAAKKKPAKKTRKGFFTLTASKIRGLYKKKKAKKKGIGIAITDHNEIGGAVKLAKEGVLLIPGIEVNTHTNKDIILYFYNVGELMEFYERYISPYKRIWPKYTISKTIERYITIN